MSAEGTKAVGRPQIKGLRVRFCFGVLVIILGGFFAGAVVTSWLIGNVVPLMALFFLLIAVALAAQGARAIAQLIPGDF